MKFTKIRVTDIAKALNHYMNNKIYEDRILEHPDKALGRTSFKISNGKFKIQNQHH